MTGFSPLQHEAEALAAGLPPLMVAADHLAASVSLGVHGRRKAGIGESFWQFRRFAGGDAPGRIDWRQSARSQHLFVREREWEAAQTVYFWRDAGPGMRFSSGGSASGSSPSGSLSGGSLSGKTGGAAATKLERANLLLMALAALLVRGGERVGFAGAPYRPAASRLALTRIGHTLLDAGQDRDAELPPDAPIARGSQFVWLGDFLHPRAIEQMERLARAGIAGHVLRIVDPAEEDFPYTGRARFEMTSGTSNALFGRAESVGDAYRARFRAHGERIAQTATRLGWTATTHRTDRPPLAALIALNAAIGLV